MTTKSQTLENTQVTNWIYLSSNLKIYFGLSSVAVISGDVHVRPYAFLNSYIKHQRIIYKGGERQTDCSLSATSSTSLTVPCGQK